MTLKLIGAIFIFVGCGGLGFLIAASHKYEVKTLKTFLNTLNYMECELGYRMTPLPDLCRSAGVFSGGAVKKVFLALVEELEGQISPDVDKCMESALSQIPETPKLTREGMRLLGRSLGRFDIEGQIKGIQSVHTECKQILDNYSRNQDARLRSYQTLGLCAGAAIAILFI